MLNHMKLDMPVIADIRGAELKDWERGDVSAGVEIIKIGANAVWTFI